MCLPTLKATSSASRGRRPRWSADSLSSAEDGATTDVWTYARTMAAVGELIAIVAVVIVLVFWVVVAVTATRVVRGVRRRYRRLRTSLVPASVVASGSSAPEPVSFRGLTGATVGSPVWWAVQQDRHRM